MSAARLGLESIGRAIAAQTARFVVVRIEPDDPYLRIGREDVPYALIVGQSFRAMKAGDGSVIAVGLDDKQLRILRDACNTLLAGGDPDWSDNAPQGTA